MKEEEEEEEEVYTIIQFFPGVISNLELTNKSSMTLIRPFPMFSLIKVSK